MLGLRKVKAGDLLCPKQFLVCNKKTVLYSDGQITQCKLNIEIYRNSSSLSSINVCSAMLSSQTCSIIWVVQPPTCPSSMQVALGSNGCSRPVIYSSWCLARKGLQ